MNILYERSLLEKEFEKDSCGIGMAVNIKGTKSHKILKNALSMLERLEHRGAVGYDETTGDGAGVSFQIPHTFFLTQIEKLPKNGEYGVAQIFIMGDVESVKCEIETYITDEVLGWREVPLNRKFV